MMPSEVKAYYGNGYVFNKKTGMSANSLANWIKWGFVPAAAQMKLEKLTNGVLKADDFDEKIDTLKKEAQEELIAKISALKKEAKKELSVKIKNLRHGRK